MNTKEYIQDITKRYGSALLKKKQAAHELQVSEMQIDRMRKSGELKFSKVGTQIRISASTIAEFMVV